MFDSGIKVNELVDELINTEVDIALDIPKSTYVSWLNSLQQLIYSEIIKEQKKKTIATSNSRIMFLDILPEEDESGIRFEDIHTVYTKSGVQLIKSTLTSGNIFPNTYYKENNGIGFHTTDESGELTIIYFVRPALIDASAIGDAKVMLPIEFIDLAKSKLRGEAYKLANEDNLAAKWINDYNVLLETFKAWITSRASSLGM